MSKRNIFKLLAIDDDPQTLSLIADALRDEGLEILTVEDPETGFQLFQSLRPRVVLLDLIMPGASGMDMLERIVRSDPAANVIVISGHYSAESAMEAIQRGACDYLTKPLDFQRLRHRIANFLAEAEIRRRTLRLDQELVQACQLEEIASRRRLMLDVFPKIR